MPRPWALAATLLLSAALVAGCGPDPTDESLPDAATLLTESATAMTTLQSAHVQLELEGEVTPSLPLKRAEGDLRRDGDAKGSLQLAQSGSLIEIQFVVVGSIFYISGLSGSGWQQMPAALATTIYDPSAILDPDRGVANIIATATEPKTEAREKVDGTDTYRVAANLDRKAVDSLVPGIPDGVTGTFWLDTEKKHLIKAVLEVPGDPKGVVTLNVSKIDEPVTVSAPVS